LKKIKCPQKIENLPPNMVIEGMRSRPVMLKSRKGVMRSN
jgi:hypothetical protein